MDGLDGLAGGMSVVILVVIGCLALVERRIDVVTITFILAGATFGFLIFNAHPASIFMGDCGSLFHYWDLRVQPLSHWLCLCFY